MNYDLRMHWSKLELYVSSCGLYDMLVCIALAFLDQSCYDYNLSWLNHYTYYRRAACPVLVIQELTELNRFSLSSSFL